ncbi:MAG: hypothetical protein U0235_28050 [Polyangiaceae bacterium]
MARSLPEITAPAPRPVIYFPAAAAHVVASAPAVERPRLRLRSLRLLYIDDEERLVTLAERVLARAGHSVTGFSQPAAAIDAFRRHPEAFDAVVSDLTMPSTSRASTSHGPCGACAPTSPS